MKDDFLFQALPFLSLVVVVALLLGWTAAAQAATAATPELRQWHLFKMFLAAALVSVGVGQFVFAGVLRVERMVLRVRQESLDARARAVGLPAECPGDTP